MRSYNYSGSAAQTQRKTTSEKNQQTLKTLLKDPANKFCADCKTAGHPRWASWNLGIFLCIRCSGIHRSLGTHISRVRSVDLDSWSDEQISMMIKWGNARANTYWEHELPDGYVPTETRIANFIRTKYELKRWVLSPKIPDPSTLDSVQTQSNSTASAASPPSQSSAASHPTRLSSESTPLSEVRKNLQTKPQSSASLIPDLLGGNDFSTGASQPTVQSKPALAFGSTGSAPSTASAATTSTSSRYNSHSKPQSQVEPPPVPTKPPTTSKPSNSLLGGDFGDFASSPPTASGSAPQSPTNQFKPGSASSGASDRQDLKKSILSLYAPKTTTTGQSAIPVSLVTPPATGTSTSSAFDSLTSGMSGLNFGNSTSTTTIAAPAVHTSMSSVSNSHQPFTSFASTTTTTTTSPISTSSMAPKHDLFANLTQSTSKPSAASPRKPSYSAASSSPWATSTTQSHKPAMQQEEEWASFSSAPPVTSSTSKPAAEDDMFANVWK